MTDEPVYLISVKSELSTFGLGFAAEDDRAAIAQAVEWAAKAHIAKGSSLYIIRPDGSQIDLAGSAFIGDPR